jgi:Tol biopolymer transport system component
MKGSGREPARATAAALCVLACVLMGAGCELRSSDAAPDEGRPVYSRDGRWVAFTSDRAGSYAVYLARVGSAARRLTDSKDDEGHYAWSPDGSRLVFSRFTGKEFPEPTFRGLFVVNRDGTGLRQLTVGDDFSACWAEGGRTIVFERSGDERFAGGIFTVAAAGSPVRRLAAGESPACSPDGRTVAIGGGTIELIDLKTRERRQLPLAAGSYGAGMPSWSPDGGRIVFEAYRERRPDDPEAYKFGVNTFWTLEELYVARVDGFGGVRRLTRNAAGDRFASWLPDGRIFFASNRTSPDAWDGGDRVDYYVMNSDGSGVRRFAWEPGARASNGSHTYSG